MKRIGANSLTCRLKVLAFFLFFLISPFCLLSHAAVITVPGDYSTIQGAIDAANDGDEIIVSPGTYYENIYFGGKNIILRSTDPTSPTIVASTIIDGRSTDTVVTFAGTESPSCILSGFTITNGRVYYEGGGIYGNGTRATIQNSNITANSAYYWYKSGIGSGGGLHDCDGTIKNNSISGNSAGSQGGGLYDCDGRIENNNISGNRAGGGGGLHGCDGTICNNTISGNNSGRDGGGLSNCNGTIRNNIISGNVAAYGIGGGLYYCSGNIQNNAICSNEAYAFGGGLYGCDGTIQSNTIAGNRGGRGAGLDSCTGFIINCIIWGNSGFEASQLFDCSTPLYSCIQDWIGGGRGNISADPRFVDPDNGNFHLQPDSPCIDAGNTYYLCGDYLVDIDGECRVEGSSLDMGSDEYASSSDSDGDLLSDEDEFNQGSDPDNTDTDLDGLKDGVEVLRGTDPTVYNGPSGIFIPAHYAIIQQGIFMAFPLEVITVSPGTYYENLRFLGKNLTLQSTDPLDDDMVSSTTIDGAGCFSVIFFEGTEDERCEVEGLTIRNGGGLQGAGIHGNGALLAIRNSQILDNQSVGVSRCNGIIEKNTVSGNLAGGLAGCAGIIRNNIIIGNTAAYGGGLRGCDGIIQNNIISRNIADGGRYNGYGGGLSYCDGTIQNNVISGNSAIGQEFSAGGGLAKCGGTIRNNTISGNWARNHGGGLYDCNDTIQNNTIIENSAGDGGGGLDRCKGFIINCIIWGNSAPDGSQVYDSSTPFYSCIQDWTQGGRGNISDDPKFVDPWNGDYHLQSGSPCIDAGNTYYFFGEYIADIDGGCRLAGNSVDIGSDEYGSSLDFDGDLLADIEEAVYNSDPSNSDSDRDGLKDGVEILRGTDPALYNTPSGISVGAEYASIQQGIFLAFPSEVATVSPGTYHENLNFLGKNLILQSTNPSDDGVVSNTIIEGGAVFTVILLHGTENKTSVIKGFTIRNGSGYLGGGICGNGALTSIENNKILNNTALQGGGLYNCNGTIENNVISGNSASWSGGGLYYCSGTIQNNTIYGNSAHNRAGGLYGCDGTIQNNIISDNSAQDYGGGLTDCDGIIQYNVISRNSCGYRGGGLHECDGTIQNNLILANSARTGGGLYGCYASIQNNTIHGNLASDYGGGLEFCSRAIRNCIIWQNIAPSGAQLYHCVKPSYSCIQDLAGGGEGNISSDPQFVDPLNGDFHLLPSSPCIDAGGYIDGLTEDFEGDPRLMDGTSEPRGDGSDFDIGADEFLGPFSVQDYDFELTEEGWTSVTLSRYFTPPECYYLPGHIILTAQDNTNTYGFWTSELDAVPVIADCLYRASWTVVTDVTDLLAVPHMQLRVNSQNLQQADILVVSSTGDGSYSPTPDGRTYEMYFIPPESALGKPEDQDDLILSFDILNFDPSDAAYGSVMLDRVVVDAIPLETLDTPTLLKTWIFDTDSESWQFGSAPIFFTPPTSTIASGALWLTAQNNTNTFGFWSGPSELVQAEAGKLYRLRFTVSTDVTVQEQVPQLRLRTSSEDFQSSIVKVVSSVTSAEMSPIPSGRTYDLYFYPPQSLVGTEADSILAAFDILNFDPADASNGALMLNSVAVESLNVP